MFILASSSPRRSQILTQTGYRFSVVPADVDETVPTGTAPEQVVRLLAEKKARAVFQLHPNDVILAADTIVSFQKQILGKPQTKEDAFQMLKMLSGKQHQVYTGFCIQSSQGMTAGTECTVVEFYPLSDSQILEYIATNEPMDKAGAYGIQGKGAVLVKKIDGDFYNVMGLPIAKIHQILTDCKLSLEI